MIPVKVISKVDIPAIGETVMADLIKAEILRTNPEIEVTGIAFERKLNPQRMEAIVDAQIRGTVAEEVPAELTETETETDEKKDPVAEEEVLDTPEEKPKRKKVFG